MNEDKLEPKAKMSGEERLSRLDALGQSLAGKRKLAIDGRAGSGIEQDWSEDEEHYDGIDDVNRGEVRGNWQMKPPGQSMPAASKNQSTVFVNITRPYVDAAAAKVGDILLPSDDRAWSLMETPIPDLIEMAKGKLPEPVKQGMQEAGVPPETQAQVTDIEAEHAKKVLEEAKAKAKKAEKRIEDWQVEGQWHAEVRKVIDDVSRIGSGVLKGPIPASKRAQMWIDGAIVVKDEIKPVSRRVDPWNFYPDPGCGESIHNGSFVWERDFLTPKKLRDLKRDPDYIGEQIDACLEEGPRKAGDQRKLADGKSLSDKDLFEIWYFHGVAEREDLEAAGCECEDDSSVVPCILIMVNDRVIKAALNPLDSGEFPYDVMPWQRRKNMPWGSGVARQIRTPQRIVTAATRHMLTNGGRAAGPIIVSQDGVVLPMDGTEDITPWKRYSAAEGTDVRAAFQIFEIPDRQASLMGIIQFGMKLAEDVTGLPLLLQGQAGSAPETLGGQQLVEKNASGTLRRIALTFDDCITEPHVRRYYDWLLQYGEDDEKGDFVIDARGSTGLVEREVYKNEVMQLLQAALNPAFDLDPALVMEEHLRTTKKDPKNFKLSDEKKAQAAQQQPQQAPNPALEVATIRSKTEMDKATLNQQADMAEIQAKAQEAEKQREHEKAMLTMQLQIKTMEFAEKRNISLDKVKGDLAKTAMGLKVQRELSGTQAITPPTEPKGRAKDGMSYQQ